MLRKGREWLGFKGAYFSDYGGISNLAWQHHIAPNEEEAARLAIEAGVDADLPHGSAYRHLVQQVRTGRVDEKRIDAAVARILALKFEAGLFENPYADARRALRNTNRPEDIALARLAAQKAIVRSRMMGCCRSMRACAVPSPSSGRPQPRYCSAAIEAENVTPIRPADPAANRARIAEAVALAKRSDVVVLAVGDAPQVTREAINPDAPGDRSTVGLFGDQDALVDAVLATGKPAVAVLLNGRPLAVTRLASGANALIEGWYLGQEGGNALADVIFGKANPGGKLTISIPRSAGNQPAGYRRHPSANIFRYIEAPPFGAVPVRLRA